jgi:hypothetical protein
MSETDIWSSMALSYNNSDAVTAIGIASRCGFLQLVADLNELL